MSLINEELVEHATRGMFITMIGGIYNPISQLVTLSNAGHLPALQRTAGGAYREHESRSLPLGIMPDQVFEEVTFSLAGSSLYLYTDGLSEGLARSLDEPDDPSHLRALIERFCNLPRQERLQHFADEVSRKNARFDDLTILLIEQDFGCSQGNARSGVDDNAGNNTDESADNSTGIKKVAG